MGYVRHHAIIVTSWQAEHLARAYAKAQEIFPQVTALTDYATNLTRSFLIPPDGSKEGWSESDEGDARRSEYTTWLQTERVNLKERTYLWVDWVEVVFGGDGDEAYIEGSVHEPHPQEQQG